MELLIISSDEESLGESNRQPRKRTISTRSQSTRGSGKAKGKHVNTNVDGRYLDRCTSNDEADKIMELDHQVPVLPIQQRSFQDWEELHDYLTAYSRSTYQVSSILALLVS